MQLGLEGLQPQMGNNDGHGCGPQGYTPTPVRPGSGIDFSLLSTPGPRPAMEVTGLPQGVPRLVLLLGKLHDEDGFAARLPRRAISYHPYKGPPRCMRRREDKGGGERIIVRTDEGRGGERREEKEEEEEEEEAEEEKEQAG